MACCKNCCEQCNTWTLNCDKCCRCVPRRFCVNFTPDGTDGSCSTCGLLLNWSEGNIYTGTLTCNGASVEITITLLQDQIGTGTGTGTGEIACYWHIEIPDLGIDDYYPVRAGGEYGTGSEAQANAVGCSDPLFLVYNVTLDGGTTGTSVDDCAGTLTITRHDNWILPIVEDVEDTGTGTNNRPGCYRPFCGTNCRCLNKRLCATYTTDECTYISDTPLVLNEETYTWEGSVTCSATGETKNIYVELVRDETTGACALETTVADSMTGTGSGTGELLVDPHIITSDCDDLNETISFSRETGTGTVTDTLALTNANCDDSCQALSDCFCEQRPLPQTLYAAIETIELFGADCPGWDGQIIELDYQFDGENTWYGYKTIDCGTHSETIAIRLACAPQNDPLCDAFTIAYIQTHNSTPGDPDILDGIAPEECICDPLYMLFGPTGIQTLTVIADSDCCHFGPMGEDEVQVKIHVTE